MLFSGSSPIDGSKAVLLVVTFAAPLRLRFWRRSFSMISDVFAS